MKAQPKPVLLTSSPTLDGILEMVRKYYYSPNCQLVEVSPDNYVVHNSNGKIEDVYVKLHKGRYRFMREG